jgi:small subunit ribosomal protein S8
MSQSDPIADMLTSIRNAQMVGLELVDIPHSRMKTEIARILKKEGYITDYVVEGTMHRALRVYLKYTADSEPVIKGIKRVSRPGLRRYSGTREIPRVLAGMGTAIVSTSSGVMTGKEAKTQRTGGEVLCVVW